MQYYIFEESNENGRDILQICQANSEQEAREVFAARGFKEFSQPYKDGDTEGSRDRVIYSVSKKKLYTLLS